MGCKQLSPCLSGVSWPTPSGLSSNTWSSPSDYGKVVPYHTMYYTVRCNVSYNTIIVFYPNLLVVGGGTHDKCAGIVRQNYTGAHIHALGWTFPQELFILRHLRREIYLKLRLARQFLLVLSFETFFTATCLIRPSLHCLIHFSKRLVLLNSNLSNTIKLTLLDSLLQEVCIIC